jgi:hypothetical protein
MRTKGTIQRGWTPPFEYGTMPRQMLIMNSVSDPPFNNFFEFRKEGFAYDPSPFELVPSRRYCSD